MDMMHEATPLSWSNVEVQYMTHPAPPGRRYP
ncbi:hypothetical protein HaLaN_22190, partial [Haematococcus lacustris]